MKALQIMLVTDSGPNVPIAATINLEDYETARLSGSIKLIVSHKLI